MMEAVIHSKRLHVSEYVYTAYNLIIHSDVELPELLPGAGAADVVIRCGATPADLPGKEDDPAYFQAVEGQLLLKIPGVAHFWVLNGNEIVIQPAPESQAGDVRAFLLGSCLGALLHQRGALALHASAIRTPAGAALFAGHSGSGKSTLLSAFLERGYEMLADDVCAIVPGESGELVVLPAIPRSKLWADAAAGLGIDTTGLARVYSRDDKYAIPLPGRFAAESLPLSRVYLLAPHDGEALTIEPLDGLERVSALVVYTFREPFLDGLRRRESHVRLAVAAAQQAAFFVVRAPRSRFSPREVADAIEKDLLEDI
jgi:hypothetical protein